MSSPITFAPPGPPGNADIIVDDHTEYQTIFGFGATLSNSILLPLTNLAHLHKQLILLP